MDAPILPPNPPNRFHGSAAPGSTPSNGHDPFDALADLFLGPTVSSPPSSSPPPLPDTRHGAEPLRGAGGGSTVPLRLVGAPQSASRAVQERMTEVVVPRGGRGLASGQPRPGGGPQTSQQAGSSEVTDGTKHPEVVSSVIEGLVLGHLPVFASAWGTQYAKHVAQSSGEPVALLRFTTGRASLDVYHAGAGRELESIATDGRGERTLEESIARAAALSPRWIIRLPDATEPELMGASVDVVTLLTGADEAAVVASYRTLKGLAGDTTQEREPRHAWRLAVMGADPVKANEAGQKVRRAVETFLGSELEMVPCVARIGSLRSALVFDAPTSMGWREAIHAIRRVGPQPSPPAPRPQPPSPPRPLGANQPDDGPASVHVERPADRAAPRAGEAMPAVAGQKGQGFTPMTFTHVPARGAGGPTQGRGLPRLEQRPAVPNDARATVGSTVQSKGEPPHTSPTPHTPPTPPTPHSASRAATGAPGWLPGLRVSPARCPFIGHIELATDDAGGLHLIARDGVTSSVQDLYTVAAWAREHAALLQLADEAIRDASAITLHVLTTTPAAHRRLLETEVRVHAMARAGDAWAVIDLN